MGGVPGLPSCIQQRQPEALAQNEQRLVLCYKKWVETMTGSAKKGILSIQGRHRGC